MRFPYLIGSVLKSSSIKIGGSETRFFLPEYYFALQQAFKSNNLLVEALFSLEDPGAPHFEESAQKMQQIIQAASFSNTLKKVSFSTGIAGQTVAEFCRQSKSTIAEISLKNIPSIDSHKITLPESVRSLSLCASINENHNDTLLSVLENTNFNVSRLNVESYTGKANTKLLEAIANFSQKNLPTHINYQSANFSGEREKLIELFAILLQNPKLEYLGMPLPFDKAIENAILARNGTTPLTIYNHAPSHEIMCRYAKNLLPNQLTSSCKQ